jgi:RND family efflux transporter MFP subunit
MRRSPYRSAIACAAVVALFASCGSRGTYEKKDGAVTVRLAPVESKDVVRPIRTSGTLGAESQMKLSFKVPGIIQDITVAEGTHVRKGEVLARLDLAEIEARLAQAQSAYEKALRDVERGERLFADSVVTLEQLQDARTGLDVAESNLRVAEFNMKHATIRAPSDGTVMQRFAEPNELVSAGIPILLFGAVSEGWIVTAGLSDRDIVRVELGDLADVRFDAYPGVGFPGRITEIAGFADQRTGTYEVEIEFDPKGFRLISGFVGKVEITPSHGAAYYILPIDALVAADGEDGAVFAYDADTGTVRRIRVHVELFVDDDDIAVTGDLADVPLVVADGAPYLSDGMAVRIETPASTGGGE